MINIYYAYNKEWNNCLLGGTLYSTKKLKDTKYGDHKSDYLFINYHNMLLTNSPKGI